MDEIGGEIVSIALPAVLALAADPLTSLVDTAFVGHLGIASYLCFTHANFLLHIHLCYLLMIPVFLE